MCKNLHVIKSSGEKKVVFLYTNRNNIDMIRLMGVHVPIQNKNMEYSRLRRHLMFSHACWDNSKRPSMYMYPYKSIPLLVVYVLTTDAHLQ